VLLGGEDMLNPGLNLGLFRNGPALALRLLSVNPEDETILLLIRLVLL